MIAAISFFGSPLGKVAGIILLIGALAAGGKVWLISHDRAITEALTAQFEQQSADAAAKEAQRQASAAKAAQDSLNAQLASAKAAEAAQDAIRESEIIDYENRLKAAQRACLLDDSDLDTIVHDSAPDGLGHH